MVNPCSYHLQYSTINYDIQTDIMITFVYLFAFKLAVQVYLHLLIPMRLSLGFRVSGMKYRSRISNYTVINL